MDSRAWKWALISAPVVLSVSACVGWGGYPPAKNVHESQLMGTWRDRECDTTLTLHPDGSASAAGIPTEMDPIHGTITQRVSGDGTWKIDKFGGEPQLDFAMGLEHIPFDLYRDEGRLLVGLTVGDPDSWGPCILTRRSTAVANALTAVQQRGTATPAAAPAHWRPSGAPERPE
ncbi:hypothetical protein ACFVDQ_45350 [Streptomyces sp. NPDC057684]|uniref:hypothetical protein n=1 Tax=unclassified Streptomyces TaxID=2593676 RepID=UPI003684C468